MKRRLGFFLQLGLTLLLSAYLVVPIVQSVLAGLTVNFQAGVKSGLTARWLLQVWELYRETIFFSLLIGLTCLGATAVLGTPLAYYLVRRQGRLSQLVEEILVMPVAVPGLATALALILSFGHFTDFRKSWAFILVGHVIFTLPFMVRSVLAVLASINLSELEESAASLGAGFWRRFAGIALPNGLPGVLAGSLMVLTLSVGEFNLTWMLHTPLTKTLPVGLADSYASMRLEVASAYTVFFFFMIVPLLVVMQRFAGWGPRKAKPAPRLVESGAPAPLAVFPHPQRNERVRERSMSGVSIRLENCAKTFADGTRALEPLNLEIAPGQIVAVLGPSGCGKTTTLRLIAGLESPDAGGRVFFGDEEVTARPIERRQVGMVFQSYALFPHLSVAGNVAYGLKIQGQSKPEQDARVGEMLELMQIGHLANRRIDQLSGGQKQRVALARALAVRPRVLLLDEPLTALDAKLRDTLRSEISSLLRSLGITAVYVTHDQAEAMALGDRIVIMDHGQVAQIGSPRAIYYRPASRFVAEFVGSLNRLQGRVVDGRLSLGGQAVSLPASGWPEGQVEVFFRPEQVSLVEPGRGVLDGQVKSAFFLGEKTRLEVGAPDGCLLIIHAPGQRPFEIGETVGLHLEPEGLFRLHG